MRRVPVLCACFGNVKFTRVKDQEIVKMSLAIIASGDSCACHLCNHEHLCIPIMT